jgi:hypothetical protein
MPIESACSVGRLSARVRLLLIALISALACLATPGHALAATPLPPQGLYEECAPSDQVQCANELSAMGGAGFKLVLNYTAWYGDAAQIEQYASEAQADGLKVIWPLDYSAWRDPGSASTLPQEYSDLAPDCGCTTNAGFLQYAINLVRSLPATWGYYIGDELDPSQEPEVASLASAIRAADPGHPLLYVGQGGQETISNLSPFASVADVVGADIYPIGQGGTPADVGTVAGQLNQVTSSAHTTGAMVLQAFSWTEYPGETQTVDPTFPTEDQMLQMRDEALHANPSMILWYSLKDILASSDPVGNWRDLVTAAFAPVPAPGSESNAGDPRHGPVVATIARRHKSKRHKARDRSARRHRHDRRRSGSRR